MSYSDPSDLTHLRDIRHNAPKEFEAWLNLDKIVAREDGAIPRKYRELIAIAVAVTTQCPYCLDVHTKAAKEKGVTEAEVAEAVMIVPLCARVPVPRMARLRCAFSSATDAPHHALLCAASPLSSASRRRVPPVVPFGSASAAKKPVSAISSGRALPSACRQVPAS